MKVFIFRQKEYSSWPKKVLYSLENAIAKGKGKINEVTGKELLKIPTNREMARSAVNTVNNPGTVIGDLLHDIAKNPVGGAAYVGSNVSGIPVPSATVPFSGEYINKIPIIGDANRKAGEALDKLTKGGIDALGDKINELFGSKSEFRKFIRKKFPRERPTKKQIEEAVQEVIESASKE